jgi:hypothetical protein
MSTGESNHHRKGCVKFLHAELPEGVACNGGVSCWLGLARSEPRLPHNAGSTRSTSRRRQPGSSCSWSGGRRCPSCSRPRRWTPSSLQQRAGDERLPTGAVPLIATSVHLKRGMFYQVREWFGEYVNYVYKHACSHLATQPDARHSRAFFSSSRACGLPSRMLRRSRQHRHGGNFRQRHLPKVSHHQGRHDRASWQHAGRLQQGSGRKQQGGTVAEIARRASAEQRQQLQSKCGEPQVEAGVAQRHHRGVSAAAQAAAVPAPSCSASSQQPAAVPAESPAARWQSAATARGC